MKRTMFSLIALALSVSAANAQSTYAMISPTAMGLPDGATIEKDVEADGDLSNQEFVIADYTFFPTRRTIIQLRADGRVCTGEWSYWFGDDPYVWPTWITVNGLTKASYRTPEGWWVVMDLDLPICRQ